jgi:glycosyltransferase involved in cell wall biosynthesis
MPMDAARSILLVTRGLDPVGTGRQVELAADGLAALGSRVVVAVTSKAGSLACRLAARGYEVQAVGRRPVVDAAAGGRLARLAARLGPAAILGFGRSQIWPLVAAKRAAPQSRTLAWLGLAPRGWSARWGLARLDGVVATSAAVGAACQRLGMAAGRIAVVPPGVALEPPRGGAAISRGDLAERLGLDPARQWTLCVAPLEPEPRLRRLLWAIDQLGVVRKDLQHVLVGAGPLLEHVRRRARAQELSERLFILPACDLLPDLLGEVRLVWQSGDVALGGALLDGMVHGVPAVAVESDAARQLIADGQTGRIVPAEPESELPRRAFGILEDADLAGRYGAAAAARAAEAFSAERFVAGLLAALGQQQH